MGLLIVVLRGSTDLEQHGAYRNVLDEVQLLEHGLDVPVRVSLEVVAVEVAQAFVDTFGAVALDQRLRCDFPRGEIGREAQSLGENGPVLFSGRVLDEPPRPGFCGCPVASVDFGDGLVPGFPLLYAQPVGVGFPGVCPNITGACMSRIPQ